MSWLRLDEDVLQDPKVAQLVSEQGPLGIAALVFAWTTAKRQNKKGRVTLSALVMGKDCGSSTELAAAAITALVTNGLLAATSTVDVFEVPNWKDKQPDARPASWQRDVPREPQGIPGLRDGTGRDPTTEKSQRATRGGNLGRRQKADAELRAIAEGKA